MEGGRSKGGGGHVFMSMTRKWTVLCGLGKWHSQSTAE